MDTFTNEKPNASKNFVSTFDQLFKDELKKVRIKDQEEIKQTKFYKTYISEKMDDIERKLQMQYETEKVTQQFREVTELQNKAHIFDQRKSQLDILHGKFHLRINKKLPYHRKIERFAQEPNAYYLHKKNDFIKRINRAAQNLDRKDETQFQNTMKKILDTDNLARTL